MIISTNNYWSKWIISKESPYYNSIKIRSLIRIYCLHQIKLALKCKGNSNSFKIATWFSLKNHQKIFPIHPVTAYSNRHSLGSLILQQKRNNKLHNSFTINSSPNILTTKKLFSLGKVEKYRIQQRNQAKDGRNLNQITIKHMAMMYWYCWIDLYFFVYLVIY